MDKRNRKSSSGPNNSKTEENHIDPAMDSSSESVVMLSGRVKSHDPPSFWRTLSGVRTPGFQARHSTNQNRFPLSEKDEIQLTQSSEKEEQTRSPSMQNDSLGSEKLNKKDPEPGFCGEIWRSILHGAAENVEENSTSDALCSLLLIAVMLAVIGIVLFYELENWPQVTRSYYTGNPYDRSRGGEAYSCGCSIPASVQSRKSVQKPSEQPNLNVCYEASLLETVTILMFSNSTFEASIHDLIQDNSPDESTRPINKTYYSGFKVTQEAHELTVQNNTANDYLTTLYLGGNRQPDIYPDVSYLLGPTFNDFPRAYMQLSWTYDCIDNAYEYCYNCNSSQAQVLRLGREVLPTNESWISCYGYGGFQPGQDELCYRDKCVIYPPKALPASLAVKSFLSKFVALPGVHLYRSGFYQNSTQLRPSVLYLNISEATHSPIRLGFLEVTKGSALWAALSTNFPSVENECTDLSLLQVCNSTSICNAFTNADSDDLRCLDFTEPAQCEKFKGLVTPDNVKNLGMTFQDIICPPSMHCDRKPPYLVTWSTSQSGKKDSLNSFLASKILNNEWAQRAGVCTKTYPNVIRLNGTNEHGTMYLETNCTWRVAQAVFCWATGRFHYLSDFPEANWAKLPENLFQPNPKQFACYRLEKGTFASWFINFFGVLFGWLGTVRMLFYGLFRKVFVPARKRFRGKSKRAESGASTVHPS